MENRVRTAFLKVLIILLLALASCLCEETSSLCSRCDCSYTNGNRTLNLNCAQRGFRQIEDWPEELPEEVVVSFSFNNITTLTQLPGTYSKLLISLDHSGIQFLDPGIFESTVNVTYVDLSYNQLTCE